MPDTEHHLLHQYETELLTLDNISRELALLSYTKLLRGIALPKVPYASRSIRVADQ